MLRCTDAKVTRSEGMTQFMQGYTDKQQQKTENTIDTTDYPSCRTSTIDNRTESKHQNKRPVDLDIDTEKAKLDKILVHVTRCPWHTAADSLSPNSVWQDSAFPSVNQHTKRVCVALAPNERLLAAA